MQADKLGSGFKASALVVPRQRVFESKPAKRKRVHWPVTLFLLALVVPWMIFLGPLRLSVYRIVLLVMIVPCLVMWMSGKAGQIRTPDIALLLYSFWCTFCLIVLHGLESVQTSGILLIETLGPYLLARCYIREADDFYNVVQLLFRIVVFLLLPFGILEFVSGQNISRDLFAIILPTPTTAMPPREGMRRVQAVFDHPILFGVVTGSIFPLVHLVLGYKKEFLQRLFMTGIVGATSMLSISSGPLIALVIQGFLLCWNSLLGTIKFRWKLLIALATFITLVIELGANRSVFDIIVSYFAFDSGSYWFRTLIWHYGTEAVLNHPLFGTGLGEWERPPWMPPSIDNFWLLQALKNGLPAIFLLLLAFWSIFLAVSFKKGLDDKLIDYRTGFLITLTGFFVVGCTVAFWDAAYVLLLFLMGSGIWMLDVKTKAKAPPS
jgi:hypothetical protein